jgi:hypothetical protein
MSGGKVYDLVVIGSFRVNRRKVADWYTARRVG